MNTSAGTNLSLGRMIAGALLVASPLSSIAMGDPYEGSLDRSAPRGVDTAKFSVPGGRPEEICIIPPHLPFAKYRDKDADDEQSLSTYDFYKAGNTPKDGAVAILPKSKSTSAAVEIYVVP